MKSPLLDYCGRVEIIHLSERTDRYWRLAKELGDIGIAMPDARVRVPEAPRPADADGFPSRGVYGNFLSHLDILRRAMNDGLPCGWVLEDDAIFRSSLRRRGAQLWLRDQLSSQTWDLCFLGHSLEQELIGAERGLIPTNLAFKWAHCYLVHGRALPDIVAYLEATIKRPPGHPEGGKMYIDGAYSLLRKLNPDVRTLVANPVLSIQRGSPSNLANVRWYDRATNSETIISVIRAARDKVWKHTGKHWPGFSAKRAA